MTNPQQIAAGLTEAQRRDNLITVGMAIALADVIRLHDEPYIVRDVLNGAGLTIDQMRQAGVEEYDLCELRKAFA